MDSNAEETFVQPTRFRSAEFVRGVMTLSGVAALPVLLCPVYAICAWKYGAPLPATAERPFWIEVLLGVTALSTMAALPGLIGIVAIFCTRGNLDRTERRVLKIVAIALFAGVAVVAEVCGMR